MNGQGIGEFVVSLFIDAADGGLTVRNLISGFGDLEVATVAEIGALWELAMGFARVIDSGMQASLAFTQFTMHTGLSAQALQRWQIAAKLSHATADDVTSSVENLAQHLANLAVGIPDSALQSLQQLNITGLDSMGKPKDAFQMLDEISARLGQAATDAAQQERILKGLGISPNLRELLLLSAKAREGRMSFVPGMSSAQEKQLDRLRQKFVEIELKAQQIGIDIAAWAAPGIVRFFEVVDRMFTVLRATADFERTGFKAWADAYSSADAARLRGEKGGRPMAFDETVLGQILFGKPTGTPVDNLALSDRSFLGLGGGGVTVRIDKHDAFHIHDAHDPAKIRDVIERDWDDLLRRRTVDAFDQQNNNGGY